VSLGKKGIHIIGLSSSNSINILVVLVDEHIEVPGAIVNDFIEPLVDGGALVLDLVQHGGQDDHVAQHILLQHVDLVQNHIGVQNEVVRKLEETALDLVPRVEMVDLVLEALPAQVGATGDVVAQIVLPHDLQDVAALRFTRKFT